MHRKNMGKEYWIFPGGHIEKGETPEEAMEREIWEELSLKITNLGELQPFIHIDGVQECFFECEVEDKEPKLHSSGNEKNTSDDWYNPEWIDIAMAKNFANLYPEPIKLKLPGS